MSGLITEFELCQRSVTDEKLKCVYESGRRVHVVDTAAVTHMKMD